MSTVAQTVAAVRGRLPPGSENFWDDAEDLIPAYNAALDDLSQETEFYELSAVMTRRKWAIYFNTENILPDEAIRVTAVWNPLSGRWLVPTTVTELDTNLGRAWEKNIDLARAWFMRGINVLGIYPKAGDDVSSLRVYFSALHPHVNVDGLRYGMTSTPMIPIDFDTALEEFMLYKLFSHSKDPQRCLKHYQSYEVERTRLKTMVQERLRHDRTPHMGARR